MASWVGHSSWQVPLPLPAESPPVLPDAALPVPTLVLPPCEGAPERALDDVTAQGSSARTQELSPAQQVDPSAQEQPPPGCPVSAGRQAMTNRGIARPADQRMGISGAGDLADRMRAEQRRGAQRYTAGLGARLNGTPS
ncbi:MAG: hypothetical protein HY904_14450 [Deltaproteobacteria bacterium]|nr:hypothetical protein [Deltaproteobacteria bacterium]